MRKVCIAIAFLLALWSCFVSARSPSVSTAKTVSSQTQSSPVNGSEEAAGSPKTMTDIHDIKPLVSVPVPVSWAAVAFWTAACIAAGGLLWGVWYLRRRRLLPSIETAEVLLSPEETALQRLASLSAETGMEGKIFYFQLSFIFREYLQGRFGIDGLEMTTEELLPCLETVTIGKDLKKDAKKFIVSCDPVKFADAPTFQDSMAADFAFVKSFVERTAASDNESVKAAGGPAAGFPE